MTRRSGSGKATGRRSTAFTTEKTAVLTPMPSVRAATAARVKAGRFANIRSDCFRSFRNASIGRSPWSWTRRRDAWFASFPSGSQSRALSLLFGYRKLPVAHVADARVGPAVRSREHVAVQLADAGVIDRARLGPDRGRHRDRKIQIRARGIDRAGKGAVAGRVPGGERRRAG